MNDLLHSSKKREHSFSILKSSFSSDTRQSMKRRIKTERRTEIYSQMRMNSRDILNTASSWPYGWPMAPIHHCLIGESKGEKELFLVKRPGLSLIYFWAVSSIFSVPKTPEKDGSLHHYNLQKVALLRNKE